VGGMKIPDKFNITRRKSVVIAKIEDTGYYDVHVKINGKLIGGVALPNRRDAETTFDAFCYILIQTHKFKGVTP
jgi:hypothetical protein